DVVGDDDVGTVAFELAVDADGADAGLLVLFGRAEAEGVAGVLGARAGLQVAKERDGAETAAAELDNFAGVLGGLADHQDAGVGILEPRPEREGDGDDVGLADAAGGKDAALVGSVGDVAHDADLGRADGRFLVPAHRLPELIAEEWVVRAEAREVFVERDACFGLGVHSAGLAAFCISSANIM
ncbi:MAG: hypothetical protein EBS50_11755, partial [Sphingomonadaceae bacterium]|nr:hypothetical protein [Sphingomonadaceae bacterium]